MKTKAIELADKIKAWREDDDLHSEPMGTAFDLLNNEIEPFLRDLAAAEDAPRIFVCDKCGVGDASGLTLRTASSVCDRHEWREI